MQFVDTDLTQVSPPAQDAETHESCYERRTGKGTQVKKHPMPQKGLSVEGRKNLRSDGKEKAGGLTQEERACHASASTPVLPTP